MVKETANKIHCHVCGNAPFTDMRLYLERSDLQCEALADYLHHCIEPFTSCRASDPPHFSRKVPVFSPTRNFHETVCVSQSYLEEPRLIPHMKSDTRFSVPQAVISTVGYEAVFRFVGCWLE